MTRFDADADDSRIALVADTVSAHRERGSDFCTLELDPDDGEDELPPWIQIAGTELNLDVTDAEYERLTTLLDRFPALTVSRTTSPDLAEGTNVRIEARTDPERIGQFVDRLFVEVYDRPEGYRLWAVEI